MLALLGLTLSVVTTLHVEGDRLVEAGKTVVLRGVEIPSFESSNTGQNVFRSCRVALEDWHANAIRLPISQDRWLGKAPEQEGRTGEYRDAVDDVVQYATHEGAYVWLELAWSDRGVFGTDLGHQAMPDANSEIFWKDVAWKYRKNPHVLFGLYRDPQTSDPKLWKDGGRIKDHDFSYDAIGFDRLITAVRKTGAKNVVVLEFTDPTNLGLADPDGNGIVYAWPGAGASTSTAPVIADGVETASALSALASLNKANRSWFVGCMHPTNQPPLIKDWTYKATPFGEVVKAALR